MEKVTLSLSYAKVITVKPLTFHLHVNTLIPVINGRQWYLVSADPPHMQAVLGNHGNYNSSHTGQSQLQSLVTLLWSVTHFATGHYNLAALVIGQLKFCHWNSRHWTLQLWPLVFLHCPFWDVTSVINCKMREKRICPAERNTLLITSQTL